MKTCNEIKTISIVEKILYLMGDECPECADILGSVSSARIVRNLCMLRNKALFCTSDYNDFRQYEEDLFDALAGDGISADFKTREDLLLKVNLLLEERIDSCRSLFPDTVKWAYIRDLFPAPGGGAIDEVLEAMEVFMKEPDSCPYGYLNWPDHASDWSKLFTSDETFLRTLYLKNGDSFLPASELSENAPESVKELHRFLEGANKVVMLVDCAKTDPLKFVSFLEAVPDADAEKFAKIRLFFDDNTPTAWGFVRNSVLAPTEYVQSRFSADSYEDSTPLVLVTDDVRDNILTAYTGRNVLTFLSDSSLRKQISDAGIFCAVLEDKLSSAAAYLKSAAINNEMLARRNRLIMENFLDLFASSVIASGIRLTDEEIGNVAMQYDIYSQSATPRLFELRASEI